MKNFKKVLVLFLAFSFLVVMSGISFASHEGHAKNACNPCAKNACNPCAKKMKNACNPCNPCYKHDAMNACNPCNPRHKHNPCGKKMKNACNPCGKTAKMPFKSLALKAVGATTNKAVEINNDGVRHFLGRHWTESGEFFEKALKADPNLAEAHFNLALVLHKTKKHQEAAEHFKKAAELAPDDQRIQNSKILKGHIK